MGFTVSSCSSSDDDAAAPEGSASTISLAKKADVTIYSGSATLYSTFGTKAMSDVMLADEGISSTVVDTGEVEVNLSVNAALARWDYIATKLSIHVRDTTDVEVVIPTPAEYYCSDADVKAIVLSHKDPTNNGVYQVNNSTPVSYTVDGQEIKLTVTYAADGIHVSTSGINSTVLEYLRTAYGDGITFEVWTYYKNSFVVDKDTTTVTRSALKSNYLDNSTVSFTTAPLRYVNAFGAIKDYSKEVYSKQDDNGIWWPYTDAACTVPLGTQYWTRSTDAKYSMYYVLTSTQNEWDCTVTLNAAAAYTWTGTDVYNKVYKK